MARFRCWLDCWQLLSPWWEMGSASKNRWRSPETQSPWNGKYKIICSIVCLLISCSEAVNTLVSSFLLTTLLHCFLFQEGYHAHSPLDDYLKLHYSFLKINLKVHKYSMSNLFLEFNSGQAYLERVLRLPAFFRGFNGFFRFFFLLRRLINEIIMNIFFFVDDDSVFDQLII